MSRLTDAGDNNTAARRAISFGSIRGGATSAEDWAFDAPSGCRWMIAEAEEEAGVGTEVDEEGRATAVEVEEAMVRGRTTGWKKTAQSQCRDQMLRETVRRGSRNEQRRGAQDARRWSSERSRPWARAGTRSPSTEQARGVPVGMMTAADQRQAR